MSLSDFILQKPELLTPRLILRALKPSDISDLKEWTADSSLYKYWGKRPSNTDLNPELLFSKTEKPTKSFRWGIEHRESSKLIGDFWLYLIENNRQAVVAFRLSPAFQGQGLAAEALSRVVEFCFSQTELQRLQAEVHVQNHASYKTLEKAGFKREGLIRQGKMVNIFCDFYVYGLLKSDL